MVKTTTNFKEQIETCSRKETDLKDEIAKSVARIKTVGSNEDIKLKEKEIKTKLTQLKKLTKQRFNATKNLLSIEIKEKETLQKKLSQKYMQLKSKKTIWDTWAVTTNRKQMEKLKEKITTLEGQLNDLNNRVKESEQELSKIEKIQDSNYENISLELETQPVHDKAIETEDKN